MHLKLGMRYHNIKTVAAELYHRGGYLEKTYTEEETTPYYVPHFTNSVVDIGEGTYTQLELLEWANKHLADDVPSVKIIHNFK